MGVRVDESGEGEKPPSVDLAVLVAAASAQNGRVPPPGLVVLGQVGLAGEVRPVRHLAVRLREAARLGFTQAIVPARSEGLSDVPRSLDVRPVADVASAVALLPGPGARSSG